MLYLLHGDREISSKFYRGTPLDQTDPAHPAPVNLAPGASATVVVVADHACGYDRSRRYDGVAFTLPGYTRSFTAMGTFEPDCGVGLSPVMA